MDSQEDKEKPAEAEPPQQSQHEDTENRDHWPHRTKSLFALIALSVNVHCFWDFPVYCFRNGGAAFLVPYVLTTVVCCVPLYIVQMRLGEHCGKGLSSMWKCIPLVKGIGYAGIFINFTLSLCYTVYAAWSFFYLVTSFRSQLPWQDCENQQVGMKTGCSLSPVNCTPWNRTYRLNTSQFNQYSYGITAVPAQIMSLPFNNSHNETVLFSTQPMSRALRWTEDNMTSGDNVWRLPAHDYFENEILHVYRQNDGSAGLDYKMVFCLLLICVVTFCALLCGVKSVSIAHMNIVPLSYILVAIVLIRAIFAFDGAAMGAKAYLKPDWSRLKDVRVWGDGALLAYFTLFPSWGAIANVASHNLKGTAFRKHVIIVAVVSVVSSIFYGFAVALLIGVLAAGINVPPAMFMTTGPELIFVAVAQAFSELSVGPLWSSFFYVSFLALVLGTLLVLMQTVVDSFTRTGSFISIGRHRRLILTAIVCSAVFFVNLALISKQGIYFTLLVDKYCNWWNSIFLSFLALVLILRFPDRFCNKHKNTEGETNSSHGRIIRNGCQAWNLSSAAILVLIFIYALYSYIPPTFSSCIFPVWAEAIGWLLTILPLLFIPAVGIKVLKGAEGDNLIEKFRNSMKEPDSSNDQWGAGDQANCDPKPNNQEDVEAAGVARKNSNTSGQPIFVVEPPPHNTVFVVPPPTNTLQMHARISATETGWKDGKVNRGTQMTRDIAAQTGDENGDGAFVEYPEHFDHPEFVGMYGANSKRQMDRNEKYKRKEKRRKRKRDKSKSAADDEQQPTLFEIKPMALDAMPKEQKMDMFEEDLHQS